MRALVVVTALAGCVACKDGGSRDQPAVAEPAPAAARGPALPPPALRRSLAPIAADEVRPTLPDAGWAVLAEPVEVGGTQVRATYCVEAAALPAATGAVTEALGASGWSNLHSRENPRRPNRFGLSGQKPPYRLTGQVFADRPECDGRRFYTELTIHKIDSSGAEPGAPVRGPAPATMRGPKK
jgi:hypothetical protein